MVFRVFVASVESAAAIDSDAARARAFIEEPPARRRCSRLRVRRGVVEFELKCLEPVRGRQLAQQARLRGSTSRWFPPHEYRRRRHPRHRADAQVAGVLLRPARPRGTGHSARHARRGFREARLGGSPRQSRRGQTTSYGAIAKSLGDCRRLAQPSAPLTARIPSRSSSPAIA